mmetsp:Transcript_28478/g.84942  ORF Transcript_28478/g.84942 Transcript_28478/m.84942 type:complete len:363 (-) Transcript_28478:131-1219(-)
MIFSCLPICACCSAALVARSATLRAGTSPCGESFPLLCRHRSSSARKAETSWLSLSLLSRSSLSLSRLLRTSASRFLMRAAKASARRRDSSSSARSCCSTTSSRSWSCLRSCSICCSRSLARSSPRLPGLEGPPANPPLSVIARRWASLSWSRSSEICSARPRAPEPPSSNRAAPSTEPTSRSRARLYLASSALAPSYDKESSANLALVSASRFCASRRSCPGDAGPPLTPPLSFAASLALSCCLSPASSDASCAACDRSRPSAIVACLHFAASSLILSSRAAAATPSRCAAAAGATRAAEARSFAACMRASCSSRSFSSSCSCSTATLRCRYSVSPPPLPLPPPLALCGPVRRGGAGGGGG